MKKSIIILTILLLIFPIVSAIEFDMKKEFSQGETLMAKVSGNFFIQLQKVNVFFYRGHVRIPIEYNIKKIDEDYYIYALLLGKEQDNYSISLENIKYMDGWEMSEEDIIINFTINNQTADFSINPGFANENEFFIKAQNLQNNEITIEVKTKENKNASGEIYQEPIILKSGQKKKIDFIFETQEPIFKIIELSTESLSYEIPVYVPATEIQEKEIFKFEPQNLIISAPTNSEAKRIIYLYNTGDEKIEDITLSLSNSLKPYINLSKESINKLDANSNEMIELILLSKEEFEVEGYIKAEGGAKIVYSSISIKFLTNYTPTESLQNFTTRTCAEMGYSICSENEECDTNELIYAKDNVCCIGTCKAKEKPGSTTMIIGISIFIIIAIFGILFYKKFKKTKKPINLLKIAKGKKK